MPQTDIQSLVESFVNDLSALVRSAAVDSVRQALGGPDTAPVKGRGRQRRRARGSRGTGRRGRPSKISPAQQQAMADRLYAHVNANAGQRATQIASALRTNLDGMRPAMQQLVAA